jgi:hypothetical protein
LTSKAYTNDRTAFADRAEEKSVMSAAVILLVLSAATGLAVGTSFSWFAILISSLALAGLSAAALHIAAFDALSGIAIIATCLTVHQVACVMGVALARRASEEAKKSRQAAEAKGGTT